MDEDDGTMSAWYIFASAGFYPLLVGGDSYELVSPIFDRISIDMGNGKTFEIKNKGT
jgi:putative alpha-1,2-mannosidase